MIIRRGIARYYYRKNNDDIFEELPDKESLSPTLDIGCVNTSTCNVMMVILVMMVVVMVMLVMVVVIVVMVVIVMTKNMNRRLILKMMIYNGDAFISYLMQSCLSM